MPAHGCAHDTPARAFAKAVGVRKMRMQIKVRCHQCGKQSQFSRSDAGLTALCVACGARFTIPADTAQTLPATAGGDELIDSALLQDMPVSGLLAPMGELEPAAPPIPVG